MATQTKPAYAGFREVRLRGLRLCSRGFNRQTFFWADKQVILTFKHPLLRNQM
ncbi:hypothetical protein [Floridanema evergladense]|uniref:Uncharacterized protein n=1 Tax=Floridaenema evergladense BLCC-F167 TaxID=3153639 RepID=A0ABV4WKG0_9CYAN